MTVQARLEDQFPVSASDPVRPVFRQFVRTLEQRFAALQVDLPNPAEEVSQFLDLVRTRINETMLPRADAIMVQAARGFLTARSNTELTLTPERAALFIIDEGPDRDLFHPTPFIAIQRRLIDALEATPGTPGPIVDEGWAIARTDVYDRPSGSLLVTILSVYGAAGSASDWVITATPGITEMSRLYYERAMAAAATAARDAAQGAADRAYVESVRQQLEGAGLDPEVFAWRNGTRPFTAVQRGVAPPVAADDASLPTSAWTRARVSEGAASFGAGAPEAFNTLPKLAAALGNDPNLPTTLQSQMNAVLPAASLNAKYNASGGTIGGAATINGWLNVNAAVTIAGDLWVHRPAEPTTGAVFFGDGTRYIYHDGGGGYHLGGPGGGLIWHSGNLPSPWHSGNLASPWHAGILPSPWTAGNLPSPWTADNLPRPVYNPHNGNGMTLAWGDGYIHAYVDGYYQGPVLTTGNFNTDVEGRAGNWVWANYNGPIQNWVASNYSPNGFVNSMRLPWAGSYRPPNTGGGGEPFSGAAMTGQNTSGHPYRYLQIHIPNYGWMAVGYA